MANELLVSLLIDSMWLGFGLAAFIGLLVFLDPPENKD